MPRHVDTYPTLRSDSSPVSPLDPSVPPYGPGDVIAGKYRVEEVLGCGGMAWVLRATHVQLNLTVALKFLRFEATRETVARFFQEGRASARMSSEAVTRVLDVDRLPDGSPFLVMEYLDGFDLQKLVDEPGWLPVTTAVDFAIQACEGLIAVHGAGIVHRDLKPANLFLTRKRSGSLRMTLIDFGISKVTAETSLMGHERLETSPHALMGSPVYMAPEQMRSTKNVDARADIWSLGVVLYELLGAGRSPFEAATLPEVCMRVMRETPESLSAIRHDLPLGLETVVSRCLEKDPSRRFPDAGSLAIALAPYASQGGQLRARRLQHPPLAGHASAPVPAEPPPPPQAQGRADMRRFDVRVPWVSVVLWGLAALFGIAVLAVGIMALPAASVPEGVLPPLGVADPIPDAVPAASARAMLSPIEAPASTEHVYTPEELPLVKRGKRDRAAVRTPPSSRETSALQRSGSDGF